MRSKWTPSEICVFTRFFSSSVIKEFAQKGYSPLASRLLCEIDHSYTTFSGCTLGMFYDILFNILKNKNHRHEYVYKNAIAQKVLLGTHSLNTACMLTEFRVGNCKADVVILNGTSCVYEIKSERDRLSRLHKQLDQYLQIFDRIQVITGENHLNEVEKSIPETVGIQVLTNRYTICDYRKAKSNVENINSELMFESLQRSEYLAILRQYGINVSTVPNTQIHTIAKQYFSLLTKDQIHKAVVDVLKKTRKPSYLCEFIDYIPDSLKAIALSVPMSKQERCRFIDVLNTQFDTALCWS